MSIILQAFAGHTLTPFNLTKAYLIDTVYDSAANGDLHFSQRIATCLALAGDLSMAEVTANICYRHAVYTAERYTGWSYSY